MSNLELINEYEKGGDDLSQAIRGLTREDLVSRPAAEAKVGLWSIQEVAIHIVDTELVFVDRLKRVIAEENAVLQAFDEHKWVDGLRYEDQSAEDGGKIMELVRKQMVRVLRGLPEAAFARRGVHSSAGPITLSEVLKKAVVHVPHHVKFIHAKRAYMGKEMW